MLNSSANWISITLPLKMWLFAIYAFRISNFRDFYVFSESTFLMGNCFSYLQLSFELLCLQWVYVPHGELLLLLATFFWTSMFSVSLRSSWGTASLTCNFLLNFYVWVTFLMSLYATFFWTSMFSVSLRSSWGTASLTCNFLLNFYVFSESTFLMGNCFSYLQLSFELLCFQWVYVHHGELLLLLATFFWTSMFSVSLRSSWGTASLTCNFLLNFYVFSESTFIMGNCFSYLQLSFELLCFQWVYVATFFWTSMFSSWGTASLTCNFLLNFYVFSESTFIMGNCFSYLQLSFELLCSMFSVSLRSSWGTASLTCNFLLNFYVFSESTFIMGNCFSYLQLSFELLCFQWVYVPHGELLLLLATFFWTSMFSVSLRSSWGTASLTCNFLLNFYATFFFLCFQWVYVPHGELLLLLATFFWTSMFSVSLRSSWGTASLTCNFLLNFYVCNESTFLMGNCFSYLQLSFELLCLQWVYVPHGELLLLLATFFWTSMFSVSLRSSWGTASLTCNFLLNFYVFSESTFIMGNCFSYLQLSFELLCFQWVYVPHGELLLLLATFFWTSMFSVSLRSSWGTASLTCNFLLNFHVCNESTFHMGNCFSYLQLSFELLCLQWVYVPHGEKLLLLATFFWTSMFSVSLRSSWGTASLTCNFLLNFYVCNESTFLMGNCFSYLQLSFELLCFQWVYVPHGELLLLLATFFWTSMFAMSLRSSWGTASLTCNFLLNFYVFSESTFLMGNCFSYLQLSFELLCLQWVYVPHGELLLLLATFFWTSMFSVSLRSSWGTASLTCNFLLNFYVCNESTFLMGNCFSYLQLSFELLCFQWVYVPHGELLLLLATFFWTSMFAMSLRSSWGTASLTCNFLLNFYVFSESTFLMGNCFSYLQLSFELLCFQWVYVPHGELLLLLATFFWTSMFSVSLRSSWGTASLTCNFLLNFYVCNESTFLMGNCFSYLQLSFELLCFQWVYVPHGELLLLLATFFWTSMFSVSLRSSWGTASLTCNFL